MIPTFYNSACVCVPYRLVQPGGGWGKVALQVRWALFHHPSHGFVMVDTGYTPAVTQGGSWALRAYAHVLGPQLFAQGQPMAVLAANGLSPEDIGTVIVTHYHADHIAGLRDFPNARLIAPGQGHDAGLRHGVFRELLPSDFAARHQPFESCAPCEWQGIQARDVFGDGEVLAVPLGGHAKGQHGLWFAQAQVFYAVDVEWTLPALDPQIGRPLAGALIADDRRAVDQSRAFVWGLMQQGIQVVLCHDPAPTRWDAPKVMI